MLLRALTFVATVTLAAGSLPAENKTRYALYLYQCKSKKGWTEVRTSLRREHLEATARLYNRTSNRRGRYYRVTNGEVPNQLPPCAKKPNPTSDEKPTSRGSLRLSATSHDFGTLATNRHPKHGFKITNCGSKTITLELVNKSCGCTGVFHNDKPIDVKPITISERLVPAPIDPQELKTENEPADPPANLPDPPRGFQPTPIDVEGRPLETPPGNPAPRAEFSASDFEDLVKADRDAAKPARPLRTKILIKPGETAKIVLSVDTGRYPGKLQQYATFETDDPSQERIKLQVRGKVVAEK